MCEHAKLNTSANNPRPLLHGCTICRDCGSSTIKQLASITNTLLACCVPCPRNPHAAQERTGLGTARRRQLGYGAHVIVLQRKGHLLSGRMEARVAARHIQLAREYDLPTTYNITHCNITRTRLQAAEQLLTGNHHPPRPDRPCSLHNALWSGYSSRCKQGTAKKIPPP